MPEQPERPIEARPAQPPENAGLTERLQGAAGLAALVAEAEATWRQRAQADGDGDNGRPGWRTFEDAFPTFYEFTNRPR